MRENREGTGEGMEQKLIHRGGETRHTEGGHSDGERALKIKRVEV